MKFNEINRIYTEKVTEWMAKGYSINVKTMKGSQGEIARIDLTNGKDIVRIFVDTGYRRGCDTIEIIVGRVNDVKPYVNNNDIIWNNKLNIIEQTTLYEVGHGSGWYGTESDCVAAREKRNKRYKNRKILSYRKDVTELPKRKEICCRAIKKLKGFKRIKIDDIVMITRCESNGIYPYRYEVIVKGCYVRIQRDGIWKVGSWSTRKESTNEKDN